MRRGNIALLEAWCWQQPIVISEDDRDGDGHGNRVGPLESRVQGSIMRRFEAARIRLCEGCVDGDAIRD